MIVKVCGLTRQQDADAAMAQAVDMCGFIFHAASPRAVTPEVAAGIDTRSMKRVGVFVMDDAEEIRRIMDVARIDIAQLHGRQSPECAAIVGPERVMRVVWPDRHPHRASLHTELQRHASTCSWYLLDAGFAGGGSGRRLEWMDLAGLRPPHPWMLAGGLRPDNVRRALSQCAPDGVDFNSGIETAPGLKDAALMEAAVRAARAPMP
jgi:phosphoribosylanthranilate isomerase